MTEKTHDKRTMANFKLRPVIYRHAYNGKLISENLVTQILGLEPVDAYCAKFNSASMVWTKEKFVTGALLTKLNTQKFEQLSESLTRLIQENAEFSEKIDRHLTTLRWLDTNKKKVELPDASTLERTREDQAKEARAARKERMHRIVGMWAHDKRDSVEIQKELREDWT